jgi:hypothetical protein
MSEIADRIAQQYETITGNRPDRVVMQIIESIAGIVEDLRDGQADDDRLQRAAAAFEDVLHRNWASNDQQAVRRHAMRAALIEYRSPW